MIATISVTALATAVLQVPPRSSMLAGPHNWPVWITAAIIAWLFLWAVALISIWRSHPHAEKVRWIWTAVATLLPIVGPLAWLLLGRERRR